MNYEERFPGAPVGYEPAGMGVFRGEKKGKCWQCNEPTRWIDHCYRAYICSEECNFASVKRLGMVN